MKSGAVARKDLKKRKTAAGNDSKAVTNVRPQPHPLWALEPELAPCPCLRVPFLDPTGDWGVTRKCWDSLLLQGMPPISWYRVMDRLRQAYGAARASLDLALTWVWTDSCPCGRNQEGGVFLVLDQYLRTLLPEQGGGHTQTQDKLRLKFYQVAQTTKHTETSG